MTTTYISDGLPYLRLPRYTHAALVELRDARGGGLLFKHSQFAAHDPKLEAWGLMQVSMERDPATPNDPASLGRVFRLTPFGRVVADLLGPVPKDRRTLMPPVPLTALVAGLSAKFEFAAKLRHPIRKTGPGVFLTDMGVLRVDPLGDGTMVEPSRELKLAFDILDGVTVPQGDGILPDFLDKDHVAYLRAALDGDGIPYGDKNAPDGRNLRPLGVTDGVGLIYAHTIEGTTQHFYRVPYPMRPFVQGYIAGHRKAVVLFNLLPEKLARWFVKEFNTDLPDNPRLLERMGLIRKRGKYDWRYTRLGSQLLPELTMALRSRLLGAEAMAPDDTGYVGAGVDIMLPDVEDGPTDSDWDILGATPEQVAYLNQPGFSVEPATPGAADTLAALDSLIATAGDAAKVVEADTGGIIEAPVPSNAELAAAKARREARHPVADLSLDDEFDIL